MSITTGAALGLSAAAATTGGVAWLTQLSHFAGALLIAATTIAATVAPQVYRNWRADRMKRKAAKRNLDDPRTGQELFDLAEQHRRELESRTAELDRAKDELRIVREELAAVREDRHGVAIDLTAERGVSAGLRLEKQRLRTENLALTKKLDDAGIDHD